MYTNYPGHPASKSLKYGHLADSKALWTGKQAFLYIKSTSVQYLKSYKVDKSCLNVAAGGRASSACIVRSFSAARASYSSSKAAICKKNFFKSNQI